MYCTCSTTVMVRRSRSTQWCRRTGFRFRRPAAACTVGNVATDPAGLPAEPEAIVVPIEDIGDAGGMTLDELIAQVAADEPVVLPKPAAAYLEEARNAGEA